MNEIVLATDDNLNLVKTLLRNGLSKQTIRIYNNSVRLYYDYLKRTGQYETPETVRAFLQEVSAEYKPSSFNLLLQGIKTYLNARYGTDLAKSYAIREMFKGIKRAKLETAVTEDGYLSYDQVKELCIKISPRLGLIIEALFWSGARVSELVSIKVKDVKINGKATLVIRHGKGGKERTTYLPGELYWKIKETFSGKVFLFETEGGRQFDRTNIAKEISRQGKNAGFSVWPHKLRHSKAMYLAKDRTLTPDQVQKALGHADPATTLRFYYHQTPTAEDMGIY
jgi:integrase